MTNYNFFAQATPTGLTSGAGNNGTNGFHFTVKGLVTCAGVWHYSSASDTQLPTSVGIYTITTLGTSGTLITSNTATWLNAPGGSSASAGSGWCFAAFTSPPNLTPGVDYMATQFRNDSVNRWFSFYSVTWPVQIVAGTAPKDESTSALSQGWYNIGTSMAFPTTQSGTAGNNFGMDVQLTTSTTTIFQDQTATQQSGSTATSVTLTWATLPTAGSKCIVPVLVNGATVTSVVDNGTVSSTFTVDKTGGSGSSHYIYRADNISLPGAGSYTVTITFSGTSSFYNAGGRTYLNVASGGPTSTNSNTATSTSVTCGNVTPTVTGALAIGQFGDSSSLNPETITLTTAGATQIYLNTNGTNICGSAADLMAPSTSAVTLAWTLGDSNQWAAEDVIYPPAGTSVSRIIVSYI